MFCVLSEENRFRFGLPISVSLVARFFYRDEFPKARLEGQPCGAWLLPPGNVRISVGNSFRNAFVFVVCSS